MPTGEAFTTFILRGRRPRQTNIKISLLRLLVCFHRRNKKTENLSCGKQVARQRRRLFVLRLWKEIVNCSEKTVNMWHDILPAGGLMRKGPYMPFYTFCFTVQYPLASWVPQMDCILLLPTKICRDPNPIPKSSGQRATRGHSAKQIEP